MFKQIKFKNQIFSKKELKNIIYTTFTNFGITRASALADDFKDLGFKFATKAGISISVEDLKIPPIKKALLLKANKEIEKSELSYLRGEINSVERFQKVIDTWNNTSETLKNELVSYFRETDPLNSIYLMAFSGARGNLSQVRQLVGMRGLMANPNGQIIDIPIINNFREGLTITDYIMSAYGARKGVVDTALKTADSGYLTRRLVDVAQDILIREKDCLTKRYISLYKKEDDFNYIKKVIGRTIAEKIVIEKKLIVKINTQITPEIAQDLKKYKLDNIKIYSPLTCESKRSICQKCYGWDLSKGKVVRLGEAIGIIAAQSIGEPGTQLTMRTFHTGGIFTSDSSLQIRAKDTGIFLFKNQPETYPSRTLYGKKIDILEKESNFFIITFQNIKKEIKLPSDTSIFIKNKSFTKKDDLIAELPFKNQQKLKSKKILNAEYSGELKIFENYQIAWILRGEVYNIPNNILFNEFYSNQIVNEKDNLILLKIIAKITGFLNIKKNKATNEVEFLKVGKFSQNFNFPIFWDKDSKFFILKNQKNEYYKLINKTKKKPIIFAKLWTKKYKTQFGGEILYPNYHEYQINKKFFKKAIKQNIKLLYIPIENHIINKALSLLLVTNNIKLNLSGVELIPGIFSRTDGFLQIKAYEEFLEEIQIKPCKLYTYLNLNQDNISNLKKINKKIYFPGEIIFEDIIIESLCLVEILKINNTYNLLVRSIQEFNIPKPKNFLKTSKIEKEKFELKMLTYLTYIKKVKKDSISLIRCQIELQNQNLNKEKKISFKLYGLKNFKSNDIINLAIMSEYIVDLKKILPKQLKNEDLKVALIAENLRNVEKMDLLALLSTNLKKISHKKKIQKFIKYINESTGTKKLIISNHDYENYFSENNTFLIKKNEILKIGDKIKPLTILKSCGQIIAKNPFRLIIHKISPIFLTSQTKLFKKSGNLILKNEVLGSISYEQIITGDIVQGLPKVEEILEARKTENAAFLAKTPGLIYKINPQTLQIEKNRVIKVEIYSNPLIDKACSQKQIEYIEVQTGIENLIIKNHEYIYLGQALTNGIINPHNLLLNYFEYYKTKFNTYEASYKSFKNIQLLLIEKIQQVYNSQDVTISDKHLEVIIKQITAKVKINEENQIFLLPGEILDLKQMEYINNILKKAFKPLIIYSPILIGITKVSLMTESFIAASSFQETTKILTTAAIEGKIDWLRGLKENVIIGGLIPIGARFEKSLKNKIIK
jgi:DNA-directed RNA polymerase subunit beta'